MQKEALFEQKNELQKKFNDELTAVHSERDRLTANHTEKYSLLQEKYQETFEKLKTLEAEHQMIMLLHQQEKEKTRK